MKRFLFLVLFAASVPACPGAGMERYEVARWTLNGGALVPKPSSLPLDMRGTGHEQTTTMLKDWLQLRPGALLFTEAINATKFPDLAKNVTIWMRFRIDATEEIQVSFIGGLTTAVTPADWKQMSLCMLYSGQPDAGHLSPFGYQDNGEEFGVGPSRTLPIRAGEDVCAAISYDVAAGTATMWANGGTAVAKVKTTGVPLKSFSGFGIGRLKSVGGGPISVREARIYSIALRPEWMEEISVAAREAGPK